MADNDLSLLCLVDGESTSFPVDIKPTKTVGHLKKAIKFENPQTKIKVGQGNFGVIFPKSHVDFLDGIKSRINRSADHELQAQYPKKAKV
ncbi:hypothetical protein BGZ96_007438 [Linnemannia gamsii]|uniref:Crinkler effector protein N-terminal domain-containing protein n=1 Tax=Linnemannia gamsii TaxID=64522 RepID=A0ABQ7K0A8_9FUNG|nr:hypothetical protein BGZ96_007438 [Linnemannia gamsii]